MSSQLRHSSHRNACQKRPITTDYRHSSHQGDGARARANLNARPGGPLNLDPRSRAAAVTPFPWEKSNPGLALSRPSEMQRLDSVFMGKIDPALALSRASEIRRQGRCGRALQGGISHVDPRVHHVDLMWSPSSGMYTNSVHSAYTRPHWGDSMCTCGPQCGPVCGPVCGHQDKQDEQDNPEDALESRRVGR